MCVCFYIRCSVGHTLQDPVDGRRIQREVDGNLHPLDNQLILNAVAVNLSEGRQEVEEVLVQAVLQVWCYLHAHLRQVNDRVKTTRLKLASEFAGKCYRGDVPCTGRLERTRPLKGLRSLGS